MRGVRWLILSALVAGLCLPACDLNPQPEVPAMDEGAGGGKGDFGEGGSAGQDSLWPGASVGDAGNSKREDAAVAAGDAGQVPPSDDASVTDNNRDAAAAEGDDLRPYYPEDASPGVIAL